MKDKKLMEHVIASTKFTTDKCDKNDNEIFVGGIMTGLYETGNPDGVVLFINEGFYVKDSDGDLLELKQVIKNGGYIKQH
jgi:hypothetical protein